MIKQINLDNLTDVISLFDNYRVFYKKQSDIQRAERYLTERLGQNEALIFCYYEDKTPIAFTLCYYTFSSIKMAKTLQLNDLYVLPEYRSQGIGEKLIQHVFEYTRQNGFIAVGIETAHDNYGAQKLYERIGFIRDTSVHYGFVIET